MCLLNSPTELLFVQVQALSSFAEVLTTAFALQATVVLSFALVSSSELEVVGQEALEMFHQSMQREKHTIQINHSSTYLPTPWKLKDQSELL